MQMGCDGDDDPDSNFIELGFDEQATRFEENSFTSRKTGDANGTRVPPEIHIELETTTINSQNRLNKDLDFAEAPPLHGFLAFPISGVQAPERIFIDDANREIVKGIETRIATRIEWFLPGDDFEVGNISFDEISSNDLERLSECDFLIANAYSLSGGMMMLLERAATRGIPAILLHPSKVKVTPMLKGLLMEPMVRGYDSHDQLRERSFECLLHLLPEIREESRRRLFRHGDFDDVDFGQQLCAMRVSRGIALESSKLLNPRMLYKIEMDPSAFSQLPVGLLPRLLEFYGIDAARFSSSSLTFCPPPTESHQEHDAVNESELPNLVSYFSKRRIGKQYDRFIDNVLLGTWVSFAQEMKAGKTRRIDAKQTPVDWKARFNFQLGKPTYCRNQ